MKLDDMQHVSQMTGCDVSILSKLSEECHVELVLALNLRSITDCTKSLRMATTPICWGVCLI